MSTSAATVNSNTATLNGTITNSGNVSITSKGFGWKASSASDFTEVTQGVSLSDQAMTYNLENLGVGTYYFYAFISFENTTAYGDTLMFEIVTGSVATDCGTVTDKSGNTYNTVVIGSQCWMKSNLRTEKYANGDLITAIAGANYYNNSSSNIENETDRGYLYNWAAVMNGEASSDNSPSGVQGICPDGWHVPSSDEFMEEHNTTEYQCGGTNLFIAKAMAANTYLGGESQYGRMLSLL